MDAVLTKNYAAGGAIAARRLVKVGSADGAVLQAAAATDLIVGISPELGADSGARCDVYHLGIAELELGGEVARGGQVTADADGKGVAVSAAGQRVGAIALQSGVSGDIIRVLSMAGTAGNQSSAVASAVMVVGAENTGAGTINVTIQLKDAAGVDLAVRGSVFAYLSDDAYGNSIVATAPSAGWAIGTDGLLIPVVTNKAAQLVSEADGDIDITITEAGADTFYLVLVMPNGSLLVSDAITFAS